MNSQNIKPVILVVDDQPSNINVLNHMLRDSYHVLSATSGEDGLLLAAQQPQPDVILLDIMMPGMDGYTACERLKSNPATTHIPVIFVTSDSQTESEAKGLKLGAVDYITKPFNLLLTHARIKNQVELKKYHDSLENRVRAATMELQLEREKLLKSELLYRSLMESAPDSVMVVNENGKIELVNYAVKEMFGYEPEELIGKAVEILIPHRFVGDHEQNFKCFTRSTYLRKRVQGSAIGALRKDGSEFPVDITLSTITQDEKVSIIADIRDLSDYEFMQKQIRHAQKMEAIGQLSGGIAHDFNNILNSVLGFTQMTLAMFDKLEREKILEYLSIVYRAGERARELVKQMLVFSRSNQDVAFSRMSLQPIVKETVKMLRSAIPSSVEIQYDIESDVPDVMMEPVQVNQAIMNIVINACDAVNKKGNVDISLKRSSRHHVLCTACQQVFSGEYVEIDIADNGSGMNSDLQLKIFDPFFTTKQVGEGTGMGLSVVHGIVHGHGGHIVVENRSAGGTLFRLLFPVAAESQENYVSAPQNEKINLEGKSRHVLVVDDDESVNFYLETILVGVGFSVQAYTSGNSAMEYFESNQDKIDLLITDQVMPKISGTELAKLLLARRSQLPIILISGNSFQLEENELHATGISQYLSKPFTKNELFRAIQKCLPA